VTDPAEWDAVVVGAGPAGSAAAAALSARGRRVLLLEKDRFPRRKVCGELLSGGARASLERLGVLERVEAIAAPVRRGTLHLPASPPLSFELPRPAWGISRFALDALLARRAAELGATVRCGARVQDLARDGAGFRAAWAASAGGEAGEARARTAIGAWGRWDALDRSLERRFGRERSRYLGWSRDYAPRGLDAADRVALYVFPGGYCGLSPVEAGRVHLAGVVSERLRRRLGPGWDAVAAHARASNPALDRDLGGLADDGDAIGTGPVYFTRKPPSTGDVVFAGDAAGALDPFSGEGQASALASGLLAADRIEGALADGSTAERLASDYAAAWRRRFGRRFAWAAAFRGLMLSPRLARVAAGAAGGELLSLAIRKLQGPVERGGRREAGVGRPRTY
jgi:flavin-dependent dehydrogenase